MEPRMHRRRAPRAEGVRAEGKGAFSDAKAMAATLWTLLSHLGGRSLGRVRVSVFAAVLAVLPAGLFAQSAAPPQTVNEAVFRSRWVGPQADRVIQEAYTPSSTRDIEPVTDWAAKLRQGLYWGSLRFRPGLGVGWEYSNRTYGGQETDQADDNSPFVAPSLGLDYTREFGPLTVSLLYGGGYVYYVNPEYNSAQAGNQRNPINQTVRLRLGHVGVRHEANFRAGATYGNGENIQVGGNTTTTTVDVGGDTSYLLTEFFTVGTYLGFNSQFTRYGGNNDNGSDLYSARGGVSFDWLATGKTTLGLNVEAGLSVQEILTPAPAAPPTPVVLVPVEGTNGITEVAVPAAPAPLQPTRTRTISRQYTQVLATGAQSVTSKVLVTGGLGAGYVTDDNVQDAEYVGIRPVYQFAVTYTPSEKTQVRLSSSFEGVQLVPSFSLGATWNPRETTSFSFSVYQNQNFSISTSSQFQVNRGFILSASQRLFSKISVNASGGWQQTENRSLSSSSAGGGDYDYAFLSGSVRWDLNDWLYWQTTIWGSSGNRYQTGGGNYPETIASTGLNLIF